MNKLIDTYALIEAIGWTIVHSLWQVSAVAIVLALVLWLLKNKSAAIRYTFSFASLAYCFLLAFSTFVFYFKTPEIAAEAFGFYQSEATASMHASSISTGFSLLAFIEQNMVYISVVWLVGFTLFCFRSAIGLYYLNSISKRAKQVNELNVVRQLKQLKKKARTSLEVRVLETERVLSPLVCGILKPTLYFPLGMINQLSENEVKAILAHELAHIVRRDYLQNIIQTSIESLFYYHPAIWWISSRIKAERENSCDDLAIEWSGDKMQYAKTLVSLQEMKLKQKNSIALSFSGNKNQLFNRIARILNQPRLSGGIKGRVLVFMMLFVAVFAIGSSAQLNKIQNTDTFSEDVLSSIDDTEVTITVNNAVEEKEEIDLIVPSPKKLWSKIKLDTIPKPKLSKKKITISQITDDAHFVVEFENGDVISLSKDGAEIPKEDFEEYVLEIEDLMLTGEEESAIELFRKNEGEYGDPFEILFRQGDELRIEVEKMRKLSENHFRPLPYGSRNKDRAEDKITFVIPKSLSDEQHALMEEQRILIEEQYDVAAEIKQFPNAINFGIHSNHAGLKNLLDSMEHMHGGLFIEDFQDSHFNDLFKNELPLNFQLDRIDLQEPFGRHEHSFIFERNSKRNKGKPDLANQIKSHLIKDGLIENEDNVSVVLNSRHLKINGKKMTDGVHEKYVRTYKELTGSALGKGSYLKFVINNSMKHKRKAI